MTLLADLHPPRLPVEFAEIGWPEIVAAVAIGLLMARLAYALVRPALRRPERADLSTRLAAIDTLPPDRRQIEELRLLRALGGTVPTGLYTGPPPDLRPLIHAAWKGRRDV